MRWTNDALNPPSFRDAPAQGRPVRAGALGQAHINAAIGEGLRQGGMIIAAPMGDPNASIPTPQPVHYRPMFGALGGARSETCVSFVSQAAYDDGIGQKLNLNKKINAVKNTRQVRKKDLVHNDYQPKIEVDSQTYEVRADGELLTCEPAEVLPLAQRYFLF